MRTKGFTLVEMLVTVLMFAIIVLVAIGVLVSAIRLQRNHLVYQQLLDQTSYAIEYIGRMIRMAKKDVNGDCTGVSKTNYRMNNKGTMSREGLMFIDYSDRCKGFYLEGGKLKEYEEGRTPNEILDLTSGQLNITSLEFKIAGDSSSGEDFVQPRVTIFMEAEGEGSGFQPKIKLQTTISQRNLD